MLCWDEMFDSNRRRFETLTEGQQIHLMAACLDRATMRVWGVAQSPLVQVHLPLMLRVVELLWWVAADSARLTTDASDINALDQQAAQMIPDDRSPAYRLPAWQPYTFALVACVGRLRRNPTFGQFTNAIEACYQIPWWLNVYPLTDASRMGKADTCELEREDPLCREDLAFQLECLQRVEEGLPLNRSLAK